MANIGETAVVHYHGTLDDGTVFDSSYGRDPLEFEVGSGKVIAGFDQAVLGLEPGEKTHVHLEPEEAYGEYNKDLVVSIPREAFPGADDLPVGERIVLMFDRGPMSALVKSMDSKTIVFDCNPELAGKALNFDIELVAVK